MAKPAPPVVALVQDLLFLSRIREAARAQSVEVRAVRDAASAVAAVEAGSRLVLVDLDDPRLAAVQALAALRSQPGADQATVIGFYGHVHAERAREAMAAGCTKVLPRSAFVQQLPEILSAG